MTLISLVATHADVDLETVARLSAGASEVASSVLKNSSAVQGTVVLATCNRYEIYAEAASPQQLDSARDDIIAQISLSSGLKTDIVAGTFATYTDDDVARHLFTVGAGLESAVVGEREIAGQVRRALIEAQHNGTASGSLIRLFQSASRAAKDVGSRTGLGARGMSIVSVALDLAADGAGTADWPDRNVVVFGTGAYAGATMALLRERGCSRIAVHSASGRAEEFTASRGGTALTPGSLPQALRDADVIIGCSGTQHRIQAAQVTGLREGDAGPLTVIDLALTKDFDPAVGELDYVTLITLESVRRAAPAEQVESLEQATDIIDSAARTFAAGQQARSMDTAIVALRRHTLGVLDTELDRVRAQHGCTAAAEEVEFALRRMVKSLLHIPTVRARELAAKGEADSYFSALEALYGISLDQQAVSAAPDVHPRPAPGTVPDMLPAVLAAPDDLNCPRPGRAETA